MTATKSYTVRRVSAWLLLNGGIAVALYLGYFAGKTWAENIFVFFTCFFAFAYFFILGKETRDKMRKEGASVPPFVSYLYDVAIITTLAGLGHFWLATAWTWILVVYVATYHETHCDES